MYVSTFGAASSRCVPLFGSTSLRDLSVGNIDPSKRAYMGTITIANSNACFSSLDYVTIQQASHCRHASS